MTELVAEPEAEMVWVRSTAGHVSVDVYHTDENCQYVRRAGSTIRRELSSIPDGVDECRICQGESIAPKDHDRSYQQALKAAARGRDD